jgi:ATP synthase protein I
MSVSLLSRNVARKLLFIQLLAVIASGLLFSLKDPFWGISAVCGGLAVFCQTDVYDFCLASSGAYTSKRPCGLDLRLR